MLGAAPRGQFYEKHIPEIFLRNVSQTGRKSNILQLGKGGPPHAPPARAGGEKNGSGASAGGEKNSSGASAGRGKNGSGARWHQ